MNIPIIFIHTGDPFYLNFSINQAHISNPNNQIYLITDVISNRYDFVKYINIDTLREEANKFKNVYKHMSTNPYNGELFCFQRWFILKQFCEINSINNFLYLLFTLFSFFFVFCAKFYVVLFCLKNIIVPMRLTE